jgi:acetyl esterase/lipase
MGPDRPGPAACSGYDCRMTDSFPAPSLSDPDLTFRAAVTAPGATPGAAPLVLVLPGGSYREHAPHEAEPVAEWLASLGINALVVRYPVDPQYYPRALQRAQDVLAAVRSGALELSETVGDASSTPSTLTPAVTIDRTRIGVLGFSAGGHLAALLSTGVPAQTVLPRDSGTADLDVAGAGAPRVDLAILAYPVISFIHEPHLESVASLLGNNDSLDNRRALSAENLVTADTPPTFLWHTADDGGVPVSHSLRYASALASHNVPFDLHVFERGDHGKGLGHGYGPLESWTDLCEAWLVQRGWATPAS